MAWTWTSPESLTETWNGPYTTAPCGNEFAGEDLWTQLEEDWLDDAAVLFAGLLGIA